MILVGDRTDIHSAALTTLHPPEGFTVSSPQSPSPRSAAAAVGAAVRWKRPKVEIDEARKRLSIAKAAAQVEKAAQAVKEVSS